MIGGDYPKKMNIKKRVLINSIVLYAKIIVSMALTLISVPLILKAMGASDYGLYNLMAGVVGMLTFLNNSLTVSSQRYMSVSMGSGDIDRINIVYNTSFYLHLLLGFAVVSLLEIGCFFIGYLNIDPDRLWCAKIIYQFLILTMFLRIVSVPFDALINAYEDMIAFAVIELIDSLLLLGVAVSIKFIPYDKLIYYGLSVCLVALLNIFLKWIWCRLKYKSFRINLIANKKRFLTKEMSGFAGWNMFGGLAMIGRNQGVAVIINLFLGTIANAAYGIANQINGALSGFSGTFQRAINPQLMKSEGMNDRNRLLRISKITSKYSVLALGFMAIPLIIVMPEVLHIWLKDDIPSNTMELSRCILIMTIVYQYSQGIMSAIQAAGDIKRYQITMGVIILLNLPLSYFLLSIGLPVYYVTIGFIVLEIVSLAARVRMAKVLIQMSEKDFLLSVVKPTTVILVVTLSFGLLARFFCTTIWGSVIITSLVSGVVFGIMVWEYDFSTEQRKMLLRKIRSHKQ